MKSDEEKTFFTSIKSSCVETATAHLAFTTISSLIVTGHSSLAQLPCLRFGITATLTMLTEQANPLCFRVAHQYFKEKNAKYFWTFKKIY